MLGMLPSMLSAPQLAVCTGARRSLADAYATPLSEAMRLYGIDAKPFRQAAFLANIGHESQGLSRQRENLNYSVDALLLRFSRERISRADALVYGRTPTRPANQEAIARCIYGGDWGRRKLGNTEPGDGWRLRGVGPMQHTGRANLAALTRRLRQRFPYMGVPDFVAQPELLLDPTWGSLGACDFWDMNDLNTVADRGVFDAVCDVINKGRETEEVGDSNGYEERLRLFDAARTVLGF